MQRKKKHQLQIQKQNYRQHILRLQKLREGQSPEQIKNAAQRKKVVELLSNIKKFHNQSKSFKLKQILACQEYEKSKQKDYTKISSVVKNSIQRFDKLALTSSEKNSLWPQKKGKNLHKNGINSFYVNKPNKLQQNLCDYSKIYQDSKLNSYQAKTIKIKMGKGLKIGLEFQFLNACQIFRNIDEFYAFQVYCGNKVFRQQDTILNTILSSKIQMELPIKKFMNYGLIIKFNRVIDHKQLSKIQFCINSSQIFPNDNMEANQIRTPLELIKNTSNIPKKKINLKLHQPIKSIPKKIILNLSISTLNAKYHKIQNSMHTFGTPMNS